MKGAFIVGEKKCFSDIFRAKTHYTKGIGLLLIY